MSISKAIKLLIFSLLSFTIVKGQFPYQRSPIGITAMDARLKANRNLGTPHYSDTTAANLYKGLDSLGNIISTGANPIKFWIRDSASGARKWIQVQGGGGGNTIYTADDVITGARTLTMPNGVVQFYAPNIGASAELDINLNGASSGTFFSRGTGSGQMYSSTATAINGFNDNATYAEIYGSNAAVTHINRIRTYQDSMVFNSYNGFYRFRNAIGSNDSVTYKPIGITSTGEIVRLSYWPGGIGAFRTLYYRNGEHARNDTTGAWGGNLDSPTIINGTTAYTLRFTGILNGVSFDENPKFNTVSTTGYVWTAIDANGNGHWAAASGGGGSSFSRQNITSGSSITVFGGNYIVKFNPSSTISVYTLTLPVAPADKDVVKIEFGGTLTSGVVVTSLTILPNSGQTIIDNTPPSLGSCTADNFIEYQYDGTLSIWYRRKL